MASPSPQGLMHREGRQTYGLTFLSTNIDIIKLCYQPLYTGKINEFLIVIYFSEKTYYGRYSYQNLNRVFQNNLLEITTDIGEYQYKAYKIIKQFEFFI